MPADVVMDSLDILRKLHEFSRDNGEQFNGIKEDNTKKQVSG